MGQGIIRKCRANGIVYDIGQNLAFEVGALPGLNGALAFGAVTPVTWSAQAC